MATYTSRFWLRRGVSGLTGTLTYAVKSSAGTHQAATTTGIAADSDDSGLYYIDVTVDTSWGSNAWIEWLDGSDKFTEAIFPSHNIGQLNGDVVDLRNNDQTVGTVEQDSTQPIKFQMSAAGLTLSTTQIAKPGGAFANTAGTFTSLGNGWYEYTPTAGETDTLGVVGLHIVASTGETVPVRFGVVSDVGTSTQDAVVGNLATGGNTFRAAYAQGVIELVENADYRTSGLDAVRISRDGGDWPDDLSGYTLTLALDMTDAYVAGGGTASGNATLTDATVSYSGTGTNTVLIATPGTSVTSLLCPTTRGLGPYPYDGQIWGVSGTNQLCLWSGPVKVVRDVRS